VSTAETATADLHTMSDHSALAVLANRSNRLNGTLEAVERMPCSGGYQIESLVIFITANFAFRHFGTSLIKRMERI
jgi:hypothetical protein